MAEDEEKYLKVLEDLKEYEEINKLIESGNIEKLREKLINVKDLNNRARILITIANHSHNQDDVQEAYKIINLIDYSEEVKDSYLVDIVKIFTKLKNIDEAIKIVPKIKTDILKTVALHAIINSLVMPKDFNLARELLMGIKNKGLRSAIGMSVYNALIDDKGFKEATKMMVPILEPGLLNRIKGFVFEILKK